MEGRDQTRRVRVVALGTVLLSCLALLGLLDGGDEHLQRLAQRWQRGSARRVELFDWVTDYDPAVHGHGDHIVGADADDPNFKISDFDYDSPSERMIAGAAETRCPMCPGTNEYYQVERSFRSGRLAAKTTEDDVAYKPEEERGRRAVKPVETEKALASGVKALASDVDSPTKALQVLLRKVIQDIRSDSESYAQVDAQRRKTAAEARLLERQRAGLRTEEADVQQELERVSNQQSDVIRNLSPEEHDSDAVPEEEQTAGEQPGEEEPAQEFPSNEDIGQDQLSE